MSDCCVVEGEAVACCWLEWADWLTAEMELNEELCFFLFAFLWALWCLMALVDELLLDALCCCDVRLLQPAKERPANSVIHIKPIFSISITPNSF